MADAVGETSAIVGEQDDGTSGEACDITSSARARQALHFIVAVSPSGIQVAETIDFCCAEKTHVDAALLEQTHDVKHLAALGRAENIGGITHCVEKFGRGSFANDAIFK